MFPLNEDGRWIRVHPNFGRRGLPSTMKAEGQDGAKPDKKIQSGQIDVLRLLADPTSAQSDSPASAVSSTEQIAGRRKRMKRDGAVVISQTIAREKPLPMHPPAADSGESRRTP